VLHQLGYRNIDGLDPSSGMLEMAAKKEVYQQLFPLYLDAEIDLPDESYDAVVAAGVLTHGHAPPESLDGMLKVVKAGGVIVFSLSTVAWEEHGFQRKIEELDAAGAWRKIDRSLLFRSYPFSEQEAALRHWVLAYRKS
jgi:SAM-dependent methyltransferase